MNIHMKAGAVTGQIGIALWLLNIIFFDKPEWVGWTVGITAILLLMAATVVIGVQKRRTVLGLGLSVLSIFFGLGYLIIFLVPEKKL